MPDIELFEESKEPPKPQRLGGKLTFKEAIEAALKGKAQEQPQENALPTEKNEAVISPVPATNARPTYTASINQSDFKPLPENASVANQPIIKPIINMNNSQNDFSFKQSKANLNYREVFKDIFAPKEQPASTDSEPTDEAETFKKSGMSNTDLTTRLYASGYKLRTYSRANTESYYSMNFVRSNKLNRDCYFIVYALLLIEIAATYFTFGTMFTLAEYLGVCGVGLVVPLIPFFVYTINPEKRIRADFNFKLSILNRSMLYLNLLVIVALTGFFGFAADISKVETLIKPIIAPALLLLNVPISSIVYAVLYKTKKYHIA